ncbi:MAG: SPOR domain-containing protein [Cyclobacteriaceae bacterium]|nr:SPOR domain-containing protein [Cyclobacteriaceae bacterium]
MEGKELYNEDDDFYSKSKKEEDEDDFGLPEIEDSDTKSDTLGDPYSNSWEEKKEEEYSYSNDTYANTDPEPDYTYKEEDTDSEIEEEEDYKSSYYEEEYGKKKSPVGWIIFAVILIIAAIGGLFWWLNRDQTPVVQAPPVVEQKIVEPEPVIEEPEPTPEPVKQAGVFEINQPTGRYHVIVASSLDVDLIRDYANTLANDGMTCNILAPRGNKKFHRLSVADYVSLNDAAVKAEQLKSTLNGDTWVIRY